jgi:hypothetical protein
MTTDSGTSPHDEQVPADPDNMNDARSGWAEECLRLFRCLTGADYEDALADLLCDLMHWSDRHPFDFTAEFSRARSHYEAETTPEEAT